jgi:hypothetical protein
MLLLRPDLRRSCNKITSYLHLLHNELQVLVEKVFFSGQVSYSVTKQLLSNCLNPCYRCSLIGCGGPYGWPTHSLDLLILDFFFLGIKETVYKGKSQTKFLPVKLKDKKINLFSSIVNIQYV